MTPLVESFLCPTHVPRSSFRWYLSSTDGCLSASLASFFAFFSGSFLPNSGILLLLVTVRAHTTTSKGLCSYIGGAGCCTRDTRARIFIGYRVSVTRYATHPSRCSLVRCPSGRQNDTGANKQTPRAALPTGCCHNPQISHPPKNNV